MGFARRGIENILWKICGNTRNKFFYKISVTKSRTSPSRKQLSVRLKTTQQVETIKN